MLVDVGGTLIDSQPSPAEIYARVLSTWGPPVGREVVAPAFAPRRRVAGEPGHYADVPRNPPVGKQATLLRHVPDAAPERRQLKAVGVDFLPVKEDPPRVARPLDRLRQAVEAAQ